LALQSFRRSGKIVSVIFDTHKDKDTGLLFNLFSLTDNKHLLDVIIHLPEDLVLTVIRVLLEEGNHIGGVNAILPKESVC
jgi:hypothetical protein